MMDIESVLIETKDRRSSSVLTSSAILIEKKYVITTSNILNSSFHESLESLDDISAGKLLLNEKSDVFNFRIIYKTDNETVLVSKRARIFGIIKCKNIDEFCRNEFKDWTVDFKENNFDVKKLVPIFIILAVECEIVSEDELKSMLHTWLLNTYSIKVKKGDRIFCRSCPFGTRNFLNSLSEGIVSNTLKNSLILSDCSCTPGCEGGLVYFKENSLFPIGIVISSLNWWRKEWVGFTLITKIEPIISQIIGLDSKFNNQMEDNPWTKLLATVENSLAQINCGVNWGTCVLLSKEKGIFLTNSHVVEHELSIRLFWQKKVMSGCLIYKTPDDSIFDLAIVRSNTNFNLMSECDTTTFTYKPGDTVYCAGYPLFSTLSDPEGATITHGVIRSCNPHMIKTSCGVYPGFSGGAVLSTEGVLLGIIVCNTRLTDIDVTYPKFNMAVPYNAVSSYISEYLRIGDTLGAVVPINPTKTIFISSKIFQAKMPLLNVSQNYLHKYSTCVKRTKLKMWYLQLKVVLWKNLIIRKRHWFLTICEALIPALLFLCIAYGRSKITGLNKKEINDVTYSEQRPITYSDVINIDETLFYYSPSNEFFSDIINQVQIKFQQTNNNIRGFATKDQLLEEYARKSNSSVIAIIFNSNKTSTHFDYTIRTHEDFFSWDTDKLYQNHLIFEPSYGSTYHWKGFLALQQALDFAYIEKMSGNALDVDIQTLEFPYPPYKSDSGMSTIFVHYLPLITLFSFIFVCPAVLKRVVEEKYSGIKELMKMVGMRSWMLWLGWFIYSMIPMIFSVLMTIIIMKVDLFGASYPLIEYADGSVLVVFLILFCMATTVACFLVSTFFKKPTLATLVGVLLWILSYFVPKYLLELSNNTGSSMDMIFMLFPNMALHYGYKAVSFYEEREIGIKWSNLHIPGGGGSNEITMLNVWGMLFFDIFLYMLATSYFDRILPGKYGVPESIFFPLNRLRQLFRKSNDIEGVDGTESLKDVEIGQGLKKGIEIINLTKKYGKNKVVKNLSMDIYQNQITVLLGHNGAGKSTTMGMITGMIKKTAGNIMVNGKAIEYRNNIADTIGLCPQYNLFFPDLTVTEHLKFFAMLKGRTLRESEEEIKGLLKRLNLEDKANKNADTLSGGMKRKLCLGMAVVGGSKILILDEPSSGMDPESRRNLWNLLLGWRHQKTILITTHFMEEADALGDWIAIMKEGELRCYGTPMYLKKTFETGYNLNLLMKKEDNVKEAVETLENEIRKLYVNDIKCKSINGHEAVFLLPFENNYIEMFGYLESNRDRLKIENISFTSTTLEDVFLNTRGGYEECQDDNSEFSSTSSTVSGRIEHDLLLTSQALLYKRYKFILGKLQTYLIPCLVSLFFMLLCIYLGQEANEYSSSGGPPFKMLLSSYGKTTVMLNNTDEPELIKMRQFYENLVTNAKSSFRSVDDVSEEIIREGIKNLPYYRQHMVVAAELSRKGNRIEAVAMYNNLALHSAPISFNLITNIVAKSVLGEQYSISVTNHPLDNINPSTSASQLSESQIGLLWLIIMPLGFLFFLGSFIYFPFVELSTNFLQIQFMSGVSPWFYWWTTFVSDFVVFSIFALAMALISLVWTPFAGINEFGALFLILVLYGYCGIPYAYLFSRKKSFSGAYALFVILGIMLGVILTVIVSVMEESGSDYYMDLGNTLRILFLIFCPPFGFTYSGVTFARKVVSNYNFDHMPRLNLLSKCSVPNPNPCCAGPSTACDDYNSYLSVLGSNVPWMLLGGKIFLLTNILIHNYCIRKICNDVRHAWYKLCCIKRSYDIMNNKNDECGGTDESCTSIKIASDDLYMKNSKEASITQENNKNTLRVSKLKKSYSGRGVVNDVQFDLKKGQCMGILGVNGAGKTTTFRMLTREEIKDNGNIYLNGVNIEEDKYLSNLGYCPQNDALNYTLSGRDILKTMAWLRGIRDDRIVDEFLREFELTEYADIPCEHYSGGNKRKLSFAVAVMGFPEVILLDEPTNGVDPASRRKFWSLIKNIKNKCNNSFVLTSHSMTECEALCNNLKIMKLGKIERDGTIAKLKDEMNGFSAKIKLKQPRAYDEIDGHSNSSNETKTLLKPNNEVNEEINKLKRDLREIFPNAEIKDEHLGLLHYYIKTEGAEKRWSKLFKQFEEIKEKYRHLIEDYSISEASLEDVFLDVARQNSTGEETITFRNG